jgi:hypothetical protein
MLFLVSYDGAEPGQDAIIRSRLEARGAKPLPGNAWIFESRSDTVLTVLWSINLGPKVRLFAAEVSHSQFAMQPYCDVRGLFRPKPEDDPQNENRS